MARGFYNCFSQCQRKPEEYKERKNKGSSWSQQWQTPHWVPKAPLSSVIASLQSKEIVLGKTGDGEKNKAYANCPNYSTNSYQRHSKRIIEKSRRFSSWLLLKSQQKLYVFTLWQKIEEDLWIIKMSFLFVSYYRAHRIINRSLQYQSALYLNLPWVSQKRHSAFIHFLITFREVYANLSI